jgi:hypothetical protein
MLDNKGVLPVKIQSLKRASIPFHMAWILVCTAGCYSSREISNPVDARGSDLEIVTKGGSRYIFSEWTSDSLGGMTGTAKWLNPAYSLARSKWDSQMMTPGTPKYLEEMVSLPKDSIASISAEHLNVPLTALAGVGVAATAAVTIRIVTALAGPWPSPSIFSISFSIF